MADDVTPMAFLRNCIRSVLVVDENPVCLREESTSFKPVKLTGGSTLVLKLDQRQQVLGCGQASCGLSGAPNKLLFPFFDSAIPGLTQICDYVVFHQPEPDGPLFVLLCEGKAASASGARSQIDSTAIFVDFLLRRIFMQAKFKSPNWEIRGITFCGEKKQLPSGGVVRTKCRYVEGGGRLRSLKYVTYPHGYDYPLSHFCT